MQYTRRDALKVGLFGSAALALPLQRAASAKSVLDNRMPSSKLPKPFTLPFRIPPVADTGRRCTTARTATASRSRRRRLEILPGFQTTVWAYNGIVPGPTIMVTQGQQGQGPVHQPAAAEAPGARATRPGRRCTCTARRRCRSSTGTPATSRTRASTRTTTTRTSSRRATLWYHDHGVHHTAENVNMGLAGAVPHARRPRAVAAAAEGRATTCR